MWSLYLFAGLTGVSAYVGIRLARAHWLSPRGRTWLSAVALGIILFVIYDVLADARGLIEGSGAEMGNSGLLFVGILVSGGVAGFGALTWVESIAIRPRRDARPPPGQFGSTLAPLAISRGTRSVQLSVVMAAGIGAHGLFEGFAVGTAFATGVLSLALVLVVGMCLHKVGEGVCICGCSIASSSRYSAIQLAGLGMLAGAPIALGILTGNFVANLTWISILSFGSAIGVMAFVGYKLARGALAERPTLGLSMGGVTLGLLVGVATSLLIGFGSG